MVIVLSLFFLVVWLVFFKFHWLPWNRPWKITIYTLSLTIALVVVGALQYYTPTSKRAVVEVHTQFIYPLVSGDVQEVFVKDARAVAAGEPLFQIDPRPFQYAVDNWTAATKLAKLALVDAQKLVKTNAIARFALDQKQAQYDQAQAQLKNAKYNLENTLVTAPADGFITMNALRPGQRVSSKTAALTFLDSSDVWIAAIIKQNGLAGIAAGKKVSVTFNAAPGNIYQSEVRGELPGVVQGQVTIETAASPIQTINSAVNAYPVRIAFPEDAPAKLRRAGGLASVTIFVDEGNPINILARILQWFSTWLDFVL